MLSGSAPTAGTPPSHTPTPHRLHRFAARHLPAACRMRQDQGRPGPAMQFVVHRTPLPPNPGSWRARGAAGRGTSGTWGAASRSSPCVDMTGTTDAHGPPRPSPPLPFSSPAAVVPAKSRNLIMPPRCLRMRPPLLQIPVPPCICSQMTTHDQPLSLSLEPVGPSLSLPPLPLRITPQLSLTHAYQILEGASEGGRERGRGSRE